MTKSSTTSPYRITVAMAIYNCASTLGEALDSLLAQTYNKFKVILCDDCSTDNTVEIAQQYVDKYPEIFKLISNEKNLKLAASLNHCLEYADTEYVARMDGDDISKPDRFQVEIDFLDSHPEYALVSTAMECFDETGIWGIQRKPEKPGKIDFARTSPFCHAPVMMRRIALEDVGNYTVSKYLRRGQDYYLWHKFYRAGYKGYNIQRPYYCMRDDRNAASRRKFIDRVYGAKIHLEVMRNLGLPVWNYPRALKGIIVGLFPKPIYEMLHKKSIRR